MQTIKLPFKVKEEILACGADLKGRFCFARGDCLHISEEFGDLSQIDNMERYQKEAEKARRNFRLRPKTVACDLHPEYFSTKFAQDYAQHLPVGRPACRTGRYGMTHDTQRNVRYIQHHHAHIASCMLDNKIKGRVIGVGFDGTGFGTDGHVWGGEFLLINFNKFRRASHLDYVAMPGGEIAIIENWRMALSYLYKAYKDKALGLKIPFLNRVDKQKCIVLIKMIKNNINSPLTSSMGRFFDGVSSLIGIRDRVEHEAQAAIELEGIAEPACRQSYKYRIKQEQQSSVIKIEEIINGIVEDLRKKERNQIISSKFHNTIAYIVKDVVSKISRKEGVKKVVLSGGVFQNKFLVTRLKELFEDSNLKVYFHRDHSTTDASIALGQIAIASRQRRENPA